MGKGIKKMYKWTLAAEISSASAASFFNQALYFVNLLKYKSKHYNVYKGCKFLAYSLKNPGVIPLDISNVE